MATFSNKVNPSNSVSLASVQKMSPLGAALQAKANPPALAPIAPKAAPVSSPKPATSSIGSYKGTAITGGDDASIQSQMAAIDSRLNPKAAQAPATGATSSKAAPKAPEASPAPSPSPYVPQTQFGGLLSQLQAKATEAPGAPRDQYGNPVHGLDTRVMNKDGSFNPLRPDADALFRAQSAQTTIDRDAKLQALVESAPTPAYGTAVMNAITQGANEQQTRIAQQQANILSQQQNQLTARGQSLSALNNAASLAQPQVAAYGQTSFDPTTGQYAGGGGLPPEVMQQYAQLAASGQYGAIPSSITGNIALNAQLNAAAKAINPSYTPIGSQAQGSALASNIAQSGTAGTDIARAGLQDATLDYNNMSAINHAADAQAKQVQTVLSASGLNTGAPAFTKAINALSGQLGSAKVAELTTAVIELQNIYSQLLNSGGTTPTGSEEQALSILNPSATPEQIAGAISQLQAAAYNRLNAQYGKLSGYQSNLGGAPSAQGGDLTWDTI